MSRLIMRGWRGRLPTGIDRVCLAYLDHYRDRSLAVVQRSGRFYVLDRADSDRLFSILQEGGSKLRRAVAGLSLGAWARSRRFAPQPGMLYLNVGHTGLDGPTLADWIAKNRLRAIYLIHDLIPITHPQYCREGEAAKHVRRIENVLGSAHGIIGNSEATLEDLRAFARAHNHPEPFTMAAWISGHEIPLLVRPMQLSQPYFVSVGTIEGRKNHILLLNVWRRLIEAHGNSTPQLVIIGQRGWEAERTFAILDDLGAMAAFVRELPACGDEELAQWIAGARALLMPSFVEGFGLPVIEALQLGTPVIATDLPVYREIAGDIPTYLDPRDETAWADTVWNYTRGGPERARQQQALKGFAAPDWPRHFGLVDKWLESLNGSDGPQSEPAVDSNVA